MDIQIAENTSRQTIQDLSQGKNGSFSYITSLDKKGLKHLIWWKVWAIESSQYLIYAPILTLYNP